MRHSIIGGKSVWNGNTAKDLGGFRFIPCAILLCSSQRKGCFHICTPTAAAGSWVHCPQPGPQGPASGTGWPQGAGHTEQRRDHCWALHLHATCPAGDRGHPVTWEWVKKDSEHSCCGGLTLQQVVSLPGRRNGPKTNRFLCFSCITDVSDRPSPLRRAATD